MLGAMGTDRTGLLIIRVWMEEGSPQPLRAHIRRTDDVSAGFEREVTHSLPEAVLAEVQEWLTGIVRGSGDSRLTG